MAYSDAVIDALPPRDSVLELAVRAAHFVPGNIVEFGVADGDSTRCLKAALAKCERENPRLPCKKVFACDSFEGLPEKFERMEVGAFACDPPQITGVELVIGCFEDSLTPDLAERVGSVSLASLDADLYSSTLCALEWLTPLLWTGSLLLFDEFVGENESEKRAFEAWCERHEMRTVKIADVLRDPSGGGDRVDRRVLFQVVGKGPFSKRGERRSLRWKFRREVRRLTRGALRRMGRIVKGRKLT